MEINAFIEKGKSKCCLCRPKEWQQQRVARGISSILYCILKNNISCFLLARRLSRLLPDKESVTLVCVMYVLFQNVKLLKNFITLHLKEDEEGRMNLPKPCLVV